MTIREDDVAIDFRAVMGSRLRLWELYGQAWGWPPETMTVEQDRAATDAVAFRFGTPGRDWQAIYHEAGLKAVVGANDRA